MEGENTRMKAYKLTLETGSSAYALTTQGLEYARAYWNGTQFEGLAVVSVDEITLHKMDSSEGLVCPSCSCALSPKLFAAHQGAKCKGVKKTISDAERLRRSEAMRIIGKRSNKKGEAK